MKRIALLGLAVMTVAMSYAQGISGTWKGMLNAGNQKLEIVFHFDPSKDGGGAATMDVPAQSAMGIPVRLNLLSADSVSLDVLALLMEYTGKLNNGVITGTFRQFGVAFPLELKAGDAGKPNRPQEPESPLGYKTEEVTFTNQKAHVSLAGTLTYPVNYTPDKKVPVVIMVTGSGAQNRDEEVFAHKPFRVLTTWLNRGLLLCDMMTEE